MRPDFEDLSRVEFLQRIDGVDDRVVEHFFVENQRKSVDFRSILFCYDERVKVRLFWDIVRFFGDAGKMYSSRHTQLQEKGIEITIQLPKV